jgi:hypothetical protein
MHMSGASAQSLAARDRVYDECEVQCEFDWHTGWQGPKEVKFGSDESGKFLVPFLVVVAIARQVKVNSATSWLGRLTPEEQTHAAFSERSWASAGNMNVRSCLVSDVQKVMEDATILPIGVARDSR